MPQCDHCAGKSPMTSERCDAVEERLIDVWLRGAEPAPEDALHATSCGRCRAVRASLGDIGEALRALDGGAAPSDALVLRTRRSVRAELAAARERADEEQRASVEVLPSGFARECARLLAGALSVLPLVLGWNWLVVSGLQSVLATLFPEPLLAIVGGAYFACVAGWLAFLYGSIPFVAHRRARRLAEEVAS